MSEIHHAVDHWVEKNKKDEFKKGLNQGIKQGESGMLILVLLVAGFSYLFFKYTQSHDISVGISNQQVLGARSTPNDGALRTIPSSDVTITNSQSIETTIGPAGIDANVEVNIDPSQLNTQPKKGIFQPKNPDATITLTK